MLDTEYQLLPRVQSDGEVLQDEKFNWAKKKRKNEAVAPHITECSEKRMEVIAACGARLEFAVGADGSKKLYRAMLCHHPLCPICKARRSIKIFHELKAICTEARRQRPACPFAMLTLTVPNVTDADLSKTITHMMQSFDRMFRRAEVKKVMVGFFRSLEVTYNKERDDYHPHYHVILMLQGGYFTSKGYIKRDRWLELWQEATRQPEITQVDIRRIKPNKKRKGSESDPTGDLAGAAAEAGKYATKDGDYVAEDAETGALTADPKVIAVLCRCLKGRRLAAYGGLLKTIRAEMKLEESEDDLIKLDPNETDDAFVPVGIKIFHWFSAEGFYHS